MEGNNIRVVLVDANKMIKQIWEIPFSFTKKGNLNSTINKAIKRALEIADKYDSVILHLVD
jgi:hypothetical protein